MGILGFGGGGLQDLATLGHLPTLPHPHPSGPQSVGASPGGPLNQAGKVPCATFCPILDSPQPPACLAAAIEFRKLLTLPCLIIYYMVS